MIPFHLHFNCNRIIVIMLAICLFNACQPVQTAPTITMEKPTLTPSSLPPTSFDTLIPRPATVQPAAGGFILTQETHILLAPDTPDLRRTAGFLAAWVEDTAGFTLPVEAAGSPLAPGSILLTTDNADTGLGAEGYELAITTGSVRLAAPQPAGVFYAAQTLRQLLPASPVSGALTLPAGTVRDQPRFAWRGMMLDVSRHFHTVSDVQRLVDLLALYKLNRLHLHLSDDQGWRIEIKSWPRLATYGGSTEVGGGRGGYYPQADYAAIVDYALERYITVVPEIDLPGHTNAALASYPELNCNDTAPALYTGTEVGFSSLCVRKEITYQFLADVFAELAAITPGPYLHIGGDEAAATNKEDYLYFIERVQGLVRTQGKQVVGWEEIAQATLLPDTLVQQWNATQISKAVEQGSRIILSPANRAYLDMKYDDSTPLGLNWAGNVSVEAAYSWDPAAVVAGVPESAVLGIEAALWSETLTSMADIEVMVFPRLPGLAEIGWSPATGRSWDEYRLRLAAHAPLWRALQINYYAAPEIPWK